MPGPNHAGSRCTEAGNACFQTSDIARASPTCCTPGKYVKADAMSIAQHGTARHGTAQHGTAQHSTAQHSTAQHSTAQAYWDIQAPGCNIGGHQHAGRVCLEPVQSLQALPLLHGGMQGLQVEGPKSFAPSWSAGDCDIPRKLQIT